MEFRDHLPPKCPPSDANSRKMEVYYLVDSDQPTEKDFLSFKERRPEKEFDDDILACQSCGLSVYTDCSGIELAKKVSRSLKKKKLAKGMLSENSGKIKNTPSRNTGDTHHTWWPNRDLNAHQLFSIVSQNS